MSMNFRRDVYRHTTPVALTVADTVVFRVGQPFRLMRWRLYVTTAIADAAGDGWIYAIDRRITPGSDTGRVEVSRISGAALEGQAAGKVLDKEVGTASTVTNPAVDGSVVTAGQEQGHLFNVGDEVVFEVINAAATAGAAVIELEYQLLGIDDGSQTDRVKK